MAKFGILFALLGFLMFPVSGFAGEKKPKCTICKKEDTKKKALKIVKQKKACHICAKSDQKGS